MTAPLSSTREKMMDEHVAKKNTDRHLWSSGNGHEDPAYSVFVTQDELGIGINCHGHVIVRPPEEWHNAIRRSIPSPDVAVLREALEPFARAYGRHENIRDTFKFLAGEREAMWQSLGIEMEDLRRARQALAGAGEVVETDELVEKVARAICKAAFGDESPWREYEACARAAIRAMLSSAPSAADRRASPPDLEGEDLEPGELRPCPFCGGEAERLELDDEENFGGSVISCKKCGASSPVHFDRKEHLDSSWNERTTLSSLPNSPSEKDNG